MQKLRPSSRKRYPRQFWLMFWGMLLSSSGASMIWPFLLIYVSGKLDLPLATITTLTTINALSALISAFLAGPITDRLGRKGVMVFSLVTDATLFLLMTQAETYLAFAILLALRGAANPLYRIGTDAMLADIIPPEDRPNAYALIRTSNNAGIAIGPAIGGFLAATSYTLAFITASVGMGAYGLLLLFFARETLSKKTAETFTPSSKERFGGYGRVLHDTHFIATVGSLAFGWITAVLMWVILPVYANQRFNIPENQYGFIPTTNALLVVSLQVLVTRITRRYKPHFMMALGMCFYVAANGLVALSSGFWGFWIAMVVMTLGELIIVPTSSTFTANISPVDMRGRYMSIYGLIWIFGSAVGPLMGGILNDNYGPQYIWIGGVCIGLLSIASLLLISYRKKHAQLSSDN